MQNLGIHLDLLEKKEYYIIVQFNMERCPSGLRSWS